MDSEWLLCRTFGFGKEGGDESRKLSSSADRFSLGIHFLHYRRTILILDSALDCSVLLLHLVLSHVRVFVVNSACNFILTANLAWRSQQKSLTYCLNTWYTALYITGHLPCLEPHSWEPNQRLFRRNDLYLFTAITCSTDSDDLDPLISDNQESTGI